MALHKTWGETPFNLIFDNAETLTIVVSGRDRWALEALIAAGRAGCTPIDTPGPRWSGYVHNLRGLGVAIETVTEKHDGPFAGTHARYVLRCRAERVQEAAG